MSQDAQPPSPHLPSQATVVEPATVVEWGGEKSSSRRRMPGAARIAAGLTGDRRLVPLTTALGGVALFLSLISEWQVTTVDGTLYGDGEVGNRAIPAGIADIGGWGGGYLAGLFLLVAAMVLLCFGPAPGRQSARLVALSTGGVLLAMLLAVVRDLGDHSRLSSVLELSLSEDQFEITYGRGIWCALAGVAATTLGAYLAGRRSRPTAPVEPASNAPLDLTVAATAPFTPPGEKPEGSR